VIVAIAVVERLERKAARQTIEGAHETLGLNYVELASALDIDRRTLLRYRKENSTPSPKVRQRMEQLREISHLLDEVFETEEAGLVWLHTPLPALRGHRPIDQMRRGDIDGVLPILAGLCSGAFV
jgi:putative toxin-antitoxin system antitoxin component (TIGR02293 family)